MSAKEHNVEKKYKLVPPDGGWGYMIIIAVIINLTTTNMFPGSFGLLYDEFMKEINMGSTHLTSMMGVYAVCAAVSGFLTNPLLSFMSLRTLTFLATVIFNAGVIGPFFVHSIFPFYLCIGVLQGTGLGIVYNLSFTVLNEYFVQRRLMAASFAQTVIALIVMGTPMFLKWSLEEFGYRGTILLVSGITFQNFIGVALIQPVSMHMKKVEVEDNEMDVLLNEKESQEKEKIALKLADIEGNVGKEKEEANEVSSETKSDSPLRKMIDAMLDKSLRKSFLLSCVSLGPAICIFADSIYSYILPQALYASNWDQYNVALALSLMGFGDLALRATFIFCSSWLLKLGSEEVYVLGIIVALMSRLGSLWSKSVLVNLIFITIIGAAHCSIATLIPVVIADAVPPEKFTAAMGIFMLMSGIVNMVCGPAIGAVRDLSQSYGAAFYLLASIYAMTALFWLIELCYKKNKHKREMRKEYLKQKQLNKA